MNLKLVALLLLVDATAAPGVFQLAVSVVPDLLTVMSCRYAVGVPSTDVETYAHFAFAGLPPSVHL